MHEIILVYLLHLCKAMFYSLHPYHLMCVVPSKQCSDVKYSKETDQELQKYIFDPNKANKLSYSGNNFLIRCQSHIKEQLEYNV